MVSKLPTLARVLLGLIFFVFGLNGFLQFLPQPPLPAPAGAFIGALVQSGYLMLLVKLVEVVAGALLLANRQVPLALTLLAPIVVNILLFHAFLAPGGMALPVVVTTLTAYLAWTRRAAFAPMFREPRAAAQESRKSLSATASAAG